MFISNNFNIKNKDKCFIVLAHQLNQNNLDISSIGKARCQRLYKEVCKLDKDNYFIIFMGCGRKDLMFQSKWNISKHMYKYFSKNFFEPKNFILDKNSLDTVGDAIFSYLIQKKFKFNGKTFVVSSDWHIERVEKIFKKIYHQKNDINFISTSEMEKININELAKIILKEKKSIQEFKKNFSRFSNKVIDPYNFLKENHTLYHSI